jgi:hypothetical protein
MSNNAAPQPTPRFKAWVKRLGFWGFAFFLVKGLLWLIIPTALVYFGIDW